MKLVSLSAVFRYCEAVRESGVPRRLALRRGNLGGAGSIHKDVRLAEG
jgi:hypothetical protein